MFKKITSLAAAVVVASGFGLATAPSAFAAGETISLGSISTNPVAGTASTKSISVTTANVSGGTPLTLTWVSDSSGTACSPSCSPTGLSTGFVVVSGNAATITLTVANTAVAGTYYLKATPSGASASAVVTITVDAAQQNNNSSSNSSSDAAAAIAALAAKVATAKATLVDSIKSGKPLTAADLNAADLTVASTKAAERVNAKIQTLPEAQRADLAKIKVIVERENFVEKVSSAATQFQVNTRDLVRVGLVAPDYVFKGAVVRSLLAADPVVLATIEQVEAAVKEAQAAVQARKDRLAAIIAKINGTK